MKLIPKRYMRASESGERIFDVLTRKGEWLPKTTILSRAALTPNQFDMGVRWIRDTFDQDALVCTFGRRARWGFPDGDEAHQVDAYAKGVARKTTAYLNRTGKVAIANANKTGARADRQLAQMIEHAAGMVAVLTAS